jgi:hypothetical protein
MRHQPPYCRNRDVLRTVDTTFAAFLRCGEFGHTGKMLTWDAIAMIISLDVALPFRYPRRTKAVTVVSSATISVLITA